VEAKSTALAERAQEEHIPEELKRRPQWVCWRWGKRDGKVTKVPVNPSWPSKLARTDDRTTWSSFKQAAGVYKRNPALSGIGYVFSEDDDYCGVDFDRCIDGNGEIDPFAGQWLKTLGGYQERSVSGTGIHAVFRASLPGGRGRVKSNPGGQTAKVELYDRTRFFCFTGQVCRDFEEIEDSQQAVDEFLDALFPPKPRKKPRSQVPTNLDDAELLDRARNAANGQKFMALFDKGDISAYGHDHSRADYALLNMLIFWTGGDADRVERLFEESALYRERAKHKGYAALSAKNAIDSYSGAFYDKERARGAVEHALPPYFNLLLQPIWTERKAVSAYKAYAAMLIMATERGVKTDKGIRIGVDIRGLAETCNVSIVTLSNNALPWLLKNKFVRWRRGKGERAGYFILLTPAVGFNTIYPRQFIYSVKGYGELRQLIRLCYGRSKKRLLGRLGSLAAMVLLPLVISDKQLTLAELSEITGRKTSHLKSVVAKLVDASLVVEAREGVYRLPMDFWQRFEGELEESGIPESERLRKRRHDYQREGRKLYKGKPADEGPERPKKKKDAVVSDVAEVSAIARRYFPNRDGLPEPPPATRDPLAHVGTDKVRFYKRRDPALHNDGHDGATDKMPTESVGSGNGGATLPVCKKHHAHDCGECYRELDRLVDQGMKPKFAVEGVYLEGGVA
jgi:putative DNA primase/helicase